MTRKTQNRLNSLADRFRFSTKLPVPQFQIDQFQEGMSVLTSDIKELELRLADLKGYRSSLRKAYFVALKNKKR